MIKDSVSFAVLHCVGKDSCSCAFVVSYNLMHFGVSFLLGKLTSTIEV